MKKNYTHLNKLIILLVIVLGQACKDKESLPTPSTTDDINDPNQNKVAAFYGGDNDGKAASIAINTANLPEGTFTYDFWAFTEQEIKIQNEAVQGTNQGVLWGQNFAICPGGGHENGDVNKRGTGISIGKNAVTIIEYGRYYFNSRLLHQADLKGWNHYTVVYDKSAVNLYINGQLVRAKAAPAKEIVIPYMTSLGLGYPGYDPNDNFKGKIDEFRIWNKALTVSEIMTIFTTKKVENDLAQSLIVYYDFDDKTANNKSKLGSANNGKLENFQPSNFIVENVK